MTLAAVLGISFLPLGIWVLWLSRSKTLSLPRALAGILMGLFAVLSASFIQALIEPFRGAIASRFSPAMASWADAFIRIALVEETCKLLAVVFLSRGRIWANRDAGGIRRILSLAVLVALSFAAFENLLYGVSLPSALTLRTLAALPLHVSVLVFSAFYIARGCRGFFYPLAAVCFHGLFNLCMAAAYPFPFVAFLLVPVLAFAAYGIWLASADDSVLPQGPA